MYIKIYFNDKPLFLCDSIDSELEPYRHHDDTMFIDEFSTHALKSMIHEMEQQKIHAGILLHANLDALKKAFWKKFSVIQAAGGLVLTSRRETLMIFRRGKWDLPKGKQDPGEDLETCALREVAEETGLHTVSLENKIIETYHYYPMKNKKVLKHTHWYRMQFTGTELTVPQIEEDIQDLQWIKPENVDKYLKFSYENIREVFRAADF